MATLEQNKTDALFKQAQGIQTGINEVVAQRGLSLNAQGDGSYVATPINTSAKTVTANNLGGVNPLAIPNITPTTFKPVTVANPPGTTIDANGVATITPPTISPEEERYKNIINNVEGLGKELATKADVTKKLQEEQQLALKTEAKVASYNTYNNKKQEYQQQIDRLYNTPGKTSGQIQQEVAQISRQANADLANLALYAQADQGFLDAAEKTIQDKLDAQFQPIQDQIDYYTKFAQLNANDLTESQKLKLAEIADQKKADLTSLRETSDALHKSFLENGAPQTVYAALDKINDYFIAGKINAEEAKSKMYAASGRYGVDALRKAQIDKINQETRDAGIPAITNPNSSQYAGALSVILGSTKLTKEQKSTLINAVNSGSDPVAVLKNQAKTVMTGANQTKVESYETAQESLKDISSNLQRFYDAGGKTNIFNGNYEKVVNKLGTVNDPKLVEIATEIQQGLQIYRNAVSGTAYSVQEGSDIASIFPGITKGEILNNSIIKGRMNAFESGIDGAYRGILGSTYDELKNTQSSQSNPSATTSTTPVAKDGDTKDYNGTTYKVVGGVWTPQGTTTTPAQPTVTKPTNPLGGLFSGYKPFSLGSFFK